MCDDPRFNDVVSKMETKLSDEYSFEYFINFKWDHIEDRDPIPAYNEYKLKLDKKYKNIDYKGFTFITLSPDHNNRNIEYSEENFLKLIQFCKSQFTEFNYSFYYWVIESGKNENDPHYHIHALVRIKNPRHHKRDLCCLWKKFFPPLIGDDYHIRKCNTKEMYEDKLNYMINDRKGTHMNFEDLSLRGGMGSSGVITSK
jgi:hypothetical protein